MLNQNKKSENKKDKKEIEEIELIEIKEPQQTSLMFRRTTNQRTYFLPNVFPKAKDAQVAQVISNIRNQNF